MTDGIWQKKADRSIEKESYGIDGNLTEKLSETVCKITKANDHIHFYIRIQANEPVKRENFNKKNNLMTPSFSMVDKLSFDHFMMYLTTKQESFWLAAKNQMKLKGYI